MSLREWVSLAERGDPAAYDGPSLEDARSCVEQLEATRAALQALVDYADGKVGDDFGTTEWNRAREVLNA